MQCCHSSDPSQHQSDHADHQTKKPIPVFQIMIIGAILAVIALFAWLARPTTSASTDGTATVAEQTEGGTLVMEPSSFDFGAISMAAGKVTRDVTITNTGENPVTLTKLYTSCMCTAAELVRGEERFGPFGMPMHGPIPTISQTLAPGEEAMIVVTFDPAAHGPAGVGRISRSVTLESDVAPDVLINFKAEVTP